MVEYELDDFQHMDNEASFEYQIIKHWEEIIVEVIIGTLVRWWLCEAPNTLSSLVNKTYFWKKINVLNMIDMV